MDEVRTPRQSRQHKTEEGLAWPLSDVNDLGAVQTAPAGERDQTGPTAGTRFTLGTAAERYQDRYWHAREFDTVETLRPLAAEAGMPLARLAIAWMLAEPAITAPIVGASRPDQLDDVLAAPEKPIDALLKSRLDEITREYRWGDDPR